ncbi:MAG TPA: hypothetical protein VEH06_06110, partial [Candidatus Bathyarchaeia archaeon]|nr:hypothetical protein [Candidatus Bathyarchaeia archaeon]
ASDVGGIPVPCKVTWKLLASKFARDQFDPLRFIRSSASLIWREQNGKYYFQKGCGEYCWTVM